MGDMTTIPLTKKTREKLKEFGTKGETYDIILNNLMENAQYIAFMERQYAILKNKDGFIPLDDLS